MKRRRKGPSEVATLRREAELRLASLAAAVTTREDPDSARLLHELQVHQIELEMQNDELEKARVAAEAARDQFQELYDFAPVGYFTLDRAGTISAANLAGAALVGVERARLLGRRFVEFVLTECRAEFTDLTENATSAGTGFSGEVVLDLEGVEPRTVRLQGSVAGNGAEREPQLRLVAIDITDRVTSEREREVLHARLAKVETLESVGRLAGGVAHEFNNMLGVILGITDLALTRIESSNPSFGDFLSIRDSAQRVAALTGRLLAYASRQAANPRRLELDATVEALLEILRTTLGAGTELTFEARKPLWPVFLDPRQVDQVLSDLTVSARQALSGAGRLMLRAENVVVAEDRWGGGPVAGEYVCLTVAHTGAGMDPETLGRVFEPLGTTRRAGEGSALALACVYGIVRQNDGYVEVESEPRGGTQFRLYFPRASAESAVDRPPTRADSGRLRRCVLLVEDEPAVLLMVTRMLERLGYRTLLASSGAEALRLAARHAGEIDLLLTEIVLPEMDGVEIADRFSKLEPTAACIFMSGYTSEGIAGRGLRRDGVRFLQKPFSLATLTAEVVAALRGSAID